MKINKKISGQYWQTENKLYELIHQAKQEIKRDIQKHCFKSRESDTNLMGACVSVGGNVCVTRAASADQTAKLQQ